MHSNNSKPKPQRTSSPLTRQLSITKNLSQNRTHKHTPPLLVRTSTPNESSPGTSDSQFLYENPSQSQTDPNPIYITLCTPLSQQTQGMLEPQPTTSETNLLEEGMETETLSDSVTQINLSGILNQTIQTNKTPSEQLRTEPSFIEARCKRLKAALIIIAKASHHKAFMETCLMRNTPPKNMSLWVKPHIYHTDQYIEEKWKDIL